MINSSTKRAEMQVSAVNGSETQLSAADVYYWEDPDFKANPKDMKFFRASKNIRHDLGVMGNQMPESLIEELLSLGAVQDKTSKGKRREIVQTNPDNPMNVTGRAQGFYVPPRQVALNAPKDASDAVSVSSNGNAEATETPLEASVNLCVVVEDAARVTPPQIKFSLDGARPAHLQRNDALDKAQVLWMLNNLQCNETLVEATSNTAALGVYVFPLAENTKVPPNGFRWKERKTTDPHKLIEWLDDGKLFSVGEYRNANLAIATGETIYDYELVVLDVDVKGGKDGHGVLEALRGIHGDLPDTLTQKTPSGGSHLLFKVPKGTGIGCDADVFKAMGSGLDVRGIGGYIVASPSTVGGNAYAWDNDKPIAPLPDTWVEALKAECPAGGKHGAVSASSNSIPAVRGELKPMDEDVLDALKVIPSNVERVEWLQVMSVLSASEGGREVAYEWSSTGAYAEHFSDKEFNVGWSEVHKGFNDGAPMAAGVVFNLAKAHNPEWVNPSTTRAQNTVQAPIVPDLGIGEAPNPTTVNSALERAIELPTVLKVRESIERDGTKAWDSYMSQPINPPLKNSAKWLAQAVLNADSDRVKLYLKEYPTNSHGNQRQLVGPDGNVHWPNATFTTAMHIGGVVLKELGRLSGGFLGLPVADRERFTDLIHDLFRTALIGAKWRDLEASSTKHNLRSKIIEALKNIEDKSKGGNGKNGKPVKAAPIEAAPVESQIPVAVRKDGFNITARPAHLGGSATPAVLESAGGVALRAQASVLPAPSVLVEAVPPVAPIAPVDPDAPIKGVVDDRDDKESAMEILCRLALATHHRNWVYDNEAKAVYEHTSTGIYKRLDRGDVETVIVHIKGSYSVGIKSYSDITSARQLLEKKLPRATWSTSARLIPLLNCIYDIEQNEKINYADSPLMFNWQLPYKLDPTATCPVFLEFLNNALSGDAEIIKALLAFNRCMIVGHHSVKKYVELTGPANSGKTQYANISIALAGAENTTVTDMKILEDSKHETSKLYGKRLVVMPDQDKFYGSAGTFKRITGGDPIRNEVKYGGIGNQFVFEGLAIITANDFMNPKSAGGAIMARRLPVEFPKAATREQIAKYASLGGIAAYIIDNELPGIFNLLRKISLADACATLADAGAKTSTLNERVERENNTVLAWVNDNAARCERGEETLVGHIVQPNFSATGELLLEMQPRGYGLYADYCTYCKGIGQTSANRINFVKELTMLCKRRGVNIEYKKERARGRNYNQYVLAGMRLRLSSDEKDFFE